MDNKYLCMAYGAVDSARGALRVATNWIECRNAKMDRLPSEDIELYQAAQEAASKINRLALLLARRAEV